MKKLSLNLEQLAVESFHVEPVLRARRGTVRGRIEDEAEPIPTVPLESVEVCAETVYCSESCPAGCTFACTISCPTDLCRTKEYTCPRSCGYIICIKFD